MPTLTYSVSNYVAFTKIKSADVNARFQDIATLLNTTKLDSTNVQANGLTRDRLAAGSLGHIAISDPTSGNLSDYGVASTVQAKWLPLSSQGSDPATPPAGAVLLYNKNKKLYTVNDAGAVTQVGAGSNSAINYVTNPDDEVDTSGWATYSSNQTATITIASPAVLTVSSTAGWQVGDPVVLTTTGALPTGLTAGSTYYVSAVPSGTTFKVSATLGGADVNTSGTQSGTHQAGIGRPVTGTGGTPTATWTRSTSSPLRGTANFLFTAGNVGDGVSYDFTIDSADQAKILAISFDYNLSAAIADGDYQVWIYDLTNAARTQPAPYQVLNLSSSLNGKFSSSFQTASNSTSYRLCLHQSKVSVVNVKVDNVQVGPQAVAYGSPVTDWASYSLTIGAVTTAPTKATTTVANVARYRRIGDSAEISFNYHHTNNTGAAAGSGVYLFPLPAGLSIDTAKAETTTSGRETILGPANIYDVRSGAPGTFTGYVTPYNSTNLQIFLGNPGAAPTQVSSSYGDLTATEIAYEFRAVVPILGWGTSVVLSNDSDTRVVSVGVQAASGVTADTTTPLSLATTLHDTHSAWNGTRFTAPMPGYYRFSFKGLSTSTVVDMNFCKNGSANVVSRGVFPAAASGALSSSATIKLTAGDYIELYPSTSRTVNYAAGPEYTQLFVDRVSGPAAIAASEKVSARYYQSVAQSAFTALSQINFDTKDFDSHGGATTGASWKYTAQTSGKYRISWTVTSGNVAWTVGQAFIVTPYKNGALLPGSAQDTCIAMATGTYRQTSRGSTLVSLNAGDFIDIRASSDVSQQPLTAGCFFDIESI